MVLWFYVYPCLPRSYTDDDVFSLVNEVARPVCWLNENTHTQHAGESRTQLFYLVNVGNSLKINDDLFKKPAHYGRVCSLLLWMHMTSNKSANTTKSQNENYGRFVWWLGDWVNAPRPADKTTTKICVLRKSTDGLHLVSASGTSQPPICTSMCLEVRSFTCLSAALTAGWLVLFHMRLYDGTCMHVHVHRTQLTETVYNPCWSLLLLSFLWTKRLTDCCTRL